MRTLDEIAADIQPVVFRLLDQGLVEAAGELVWTYSEEAYIAWLDEALAELKAAQPEVEPVTSEVEVTAEVVEEEEPDRPALAMPVVGEIGAKLDVLIPTKEAQEARDRAIDFLQPLSVKEMPLGLGVAVVLATDTSAMPVIDTIEGVDH